MQDLFDELRQLRAARARSHETIRQIEAMIASREQQLEEMTALERRAWVRRINRGVVWTGVIATAEIARRAAKESPAMTAAGAAIALTAVAAALTLPFGGDPPSEAAPRPSISAPASPARPPAAAPSRLRPEPRPEQPQRVDALPPAVHVDTPPAVERISVPDPPETVAQPVDPPPAEMPPVDLPPIEVPAARPERACVADIRLLDLAHLRLLCRL
jgi:hypothetical protein